MPKKQTYIKKTDKKGNKPWLKKVNISEYKVETNDPNKILLIVCEGQTEQLYFKSFPVATLTVKAVGLGQSKSKLVESAEEIQKKEEADIVWCVFDLDIKLDDETCIPDFENAIARATELGFNVAYSNDAFELWFYLHYQFTDSENHRTFYYDQLSRLWDVNYEKFGKTWKFCSENYKRLFDDPKASEEDAIKRAEKLYNDQMDLPHHKQNPVTKVYELVRVLNENRKK